LYTLGYYIIHQYVVDDTVKKYIRETGCSKVKSGIYPFFL